MTLSVTPPFALTERERSLLPSDTDIEFYAEHGWYLSKKLFTDDEIDELLAATERYYAGERDRTLPLRPPKLAYWDPSKGDVQRHNDYVHYEHDGIARLLRKPLIGAVAAALARSDEIRVFQSTLIYKPPIATEPTNLVPWHFDKHYWSTSISDKMLTAFIPFHDCDEEMGTITMIDGSHRWRETGRDDTVTRHFADRDPSDLESMLGAERGVQQRRCGQGPDDHPQGPHELPSLPDLPRQRDQPQPASPPGHLVSPAGRRERLPPVRAEHWRAPRVQPRRAGPAPARRTPRLQRS